MKLRLPWSETCDVNTGLCHRLAALSYFQRFYVIVLLCCILIGIAAAYAYWMPVQGKSDKPVVYLTVEKNETGDEIAEELYREGLIRNITSFKIAMRLHGVMNKLQAGYYKIPTHVSIQELIYILQRGSVQATVVTIPEGFTIQQIAQRLQDEHIIAAKDFLTEAKVYVPYTYMYGPTPEEYHVEGFLFPDTYEIPKGATAKEILREMTSEMNAKLTPEMRKQIEAKHMSIYQFVTLASIVEREALFDEERPIIAAVFLKRLQEGMPLQSCATIEYVLGERKPFLTDADTNIASPYNTYRFKGLPPGPIANPGMKSMEAVLQAPQTDYLFFVADKKGHHHFSKTYEEHLRTIESIYGHQ